MQGELERIGEPSDRDRRERLETLQVQLKDARAELADVEGTANAVLRELDEAVARAQARLDAARVRHDELQDRVRAARERLAALAEQQQEASALALGASGRAHDVDPLLAARGRGAGQAPWLIPAVVVLIGATLFVLSVMVHGCVS